MQENGHARKTSQRGCNGLPLTHAPVGASLLVGKPGGEDACAAGAAHPLQRAVKAPKEDKPGEGGAKAEHDVDQRCGHEATGKQQGGGEARSKHATDEPRAAMAGEQQGLRV